MISLAENLDACEEEYLAGLNECFPGWGGADTFDWCFRRDAGAGSADLLLANERGRLIAGSAITYRLARRSLVEGTEAIACMTASWTMPGARGRGIFSNMVRLSQEVAAKRECSLLIAFAARPNASALVLQRAGASSLPSVYLRRATAKAPAPEASMAVAMAAFADRRAHEPSSIVYRDDAWRRQLVNRPLPVYALSPARGVYAIVERSASGERLLDVSAQAPAAFAAAALCVDTAWTMDPVLIDASRAAGLSAIPGALFAFALDRTDPATWAPWFIANGERM